MNGLQPSYSLSLPFSQRGSGLNGIRHHRTKTTGEYSTPAISRSGIQSESIPAGWRDVQCMLTRILKCFWDCLWGLMKALVEEQDIDTSGLSFHCGFFSWFLILIHTRTFLVAPLLKATHTTFEKSLYHRLKNHPFEVVAVGTRGERYLLSRSVALRWSFPQLISSLARIVFSPPRGYCPTVDFWGLQFSQCGITFSCCLGYFFREKDNNFLEFIQMWRGAVFYSCCCCFI